MTLSCTPQVSKPQPLTIRMRVEVDTTPCSPRVNILSPTFRPKLFSLQWLYKRGVGLVVILIMRTRPQFQRQNTHMALKLISLLMFVIFTILASQKILILMVVAVWTGAQRQSQYLFPQILFDFDNMTFTWYGCWGSSSYIFPIDAKVGLLKNMKIKNNQSIQSQTAIRRKCMVCSWAWYCFVSLLCLPCGSHRRMNPGKHEPQLQTNSAAEIKRNEMQGTELKQDEMKTRQLHFDTVSSLNSLNLPPRWKKRNEARCTRCKMNKTIVLIFSITPTLIFILYLCTTRSCPLINQSINPIDLDQAKFWRKKN